MTKNWRSDDDYLRAVEGMVQYGTPLRLKSIVQSNDPWQLVETYNEELISIISRLREYSRWCCSTDSLLLSGVVGCGKTMLGYITIREMLLNMYLMPRFRCTERPNYNDYEGLMSVRVITVPTLLRQIKQTFNTNEDSEWIVSDYKRGLLLLDDLGAESSTEWAKEVLFDLIDERYRDMLPTIFTSNLSPTGISEKISSRIASRILEMCGKKENIIQFKHTGDFRLRMLRGKP